MLLLVPLDEHFWQAYRRLNWTRIFILHDASKFVHLAISFSVIISNDVVASSLFWRFSPYIFMYEHFSSVQVHVLLLSWTCACPCVELARGECGICGGDEGSSISVTSYPPVVGGSPGSPGSPGEPGLFGLRSLPGSGLIREWLTSSRNKSSST